MAIKYNPLEMSEEQRAVLEGTLTKNTGKRGGSAITEFGREHGVEIFSLRKMGYVNDKFIAYLPHIKGVLTTGDNGEYNKITYPVTTHTLRKLGNGDESRNFIRTIVNTRDRGDIAEAGIEGVSGKPQFLDDYLAKAYEYRDAHTLMRLAKRGIKSMDDLTEKEAESVSSEGKPFLPITAARVTHYFPIVLIETEVNKNGKHGMKPVIEDVPVLDDDGKPVLDKNGEPKTRKRIKSKLMWYAMSASSYEKRMLKANSALSLGEGDFSEGYIYEFNYTINDDELKKSNNSYNSEESKSGASLAISAKPAYNNMAKFYETLEKGGYFKEWDAEAQRLYTSAMLNVSVTNAEFETDEDLEKILIRTYGTLEEFQEKIDKLLKLRDDLLATYEGGSEDKKEVGKSAAATALGIDLDLSVEEGDDLKALPDSTSAEDGDDDLDLDFDEED